MGCCLSSVDVAGGAVAGTRGAHGPGGGGGGPGGGGGLGGGGKKGAKAGGDADAFDPASLDEDLARLYELKHPLGSGSAGETWLCRCRQTGELVAVKLMGRPLPGGMTTSIFREAKIGAQLGRGHLNIVKPRDLVLTRRHLGLVMEYVAGGNMADYILKALLLRHGTFEPAANAPARGLVLDEDEARYYFLQVVRAVDFCHRNAVVHRDLKMDNTLLDSSDPPRVKLCDFGFANWWPSLGPPPGGGARVPPPPLAGAAGAADKADPSSHPASQQPPTPSRDNSATAAVRALRAPSNVATITGTPDYMSPQILSSKVHGRARGNYDAPKADVWACGVLLCVMLLGRFPFDGAGMRTVGTGSESGSGSYGADGDDDGGGYGGAGGGGFDDYGGAHGYHDYGAVSPEEAAQRQEQDASMSVYLQQQAVLGQRAVTGCPSGSRAGSAAGGEGGGGGRSVGSGGGRAASRAGSTAADGVGFPSSPMSTGKEGGGGGGAGAHGGGRGGGGGGNGDASAAAPGADGGDAPASGSCAGGAPPRPKRWFDHPALAGSAAYLGAEARDLLARIFEPDEECRIGIGGILEHPWSKLPMPEPFHSALEQMRHEQTKIDAEVAAGAHASRDRDAALKQMVYAASQPFDPNVVAVGAAAVGAQVPLGGDDEGREGWGRAADGPLAAAPATARSPSPPPVPQQPHTADGLPPSCVRRVSLSQVNPREWGNDDPAAAAVAPLSADPAEVARFFAMHSPDGLVSAEPSRHGGEQALGALRGGGDGPPSAPLVTLGEDAVGGAAPAEAAAAAAAEAAPAAAPAAAGAAAAAAPK